MSDPVYGDWNRLGIQIPQAIGNLDIQGLKILLGFLKNKFISLDKIQYEGISSGSSVLSFLITTRYILEPDLREQRDTTILEMGILLLDAGIDVNRVGSSGNLPLTEFLVTLRRYYREELCLMLLDAGSNVTNSQLWYAAKNGYIKVCKILLSRGCDIEYCFQGQTPLLAAATNNQWDIVKFLIEMRANIW